MSGGVPVTVALCWATGADRRLSLPAYATPGAAGADILANFGEAGGATLLAPGERALIPTGLRMAIPEGLEVQIRPRSGLALKHGVTLVNSPGTIDADYRGELKVILINLGAEPFVVKRGDRIAQLVIAPVPRVEFVVVEDLDETVRGEGGFGHTGS